MSKNPIIKSFVDMLCLSLANFNKSVLRLIFNPIFKLLFFDYNNNIYILKINNITFSINKEGDLSITGIRFLEIDSELYLFDLKDTSTINAIKIKYIQDKLTEKEENVSKTFETIR